MNMAMSAHHAKRFVVVATFAAAMAWVESAVVFYLRTMVGRIEPYQPDPLPMVTGLGWAELVREAATMVMLLAVGILAGRNWRSRLGYASIAFGVWDILYYVFLKLMCGWPHSLLDWDILFLLPLPWWGPVLAPVSIAALMILWGTAVNCRRANSAQALGEWKSWMLGFPGMVLALYIFMADSLHVAGQGIDAVRGVLPANFKWSWFCFALVLMSAPSLQAIQTLRFRPRRELLLRSGEQEIQNR